VRATLQHPFRCLILLSLLSGAVHPQDLEIHYINVGWGGSVLVRGPDGTTVLLEGGRTGMGWNVIVPYLQSIGIPPAAGLDYMILGHRHTDHVGGMDEVISAGYDVRVANYENGSPEPRGSFDSWVAAAATTTAGAPVPMPLGTVIPLGNGATMTCIARNGSIIGGVTVPVTSENERSIGLLVRYGAFDFLWASDLSGGNEDESCTGRSAASIDVETSLIQAISPGGASPMISAGGIDVLHVNHHGAETCTNANYMNYAQPSLAVISIGAGQSLTENRPRIDVVENVLLATVPCVTAPPTLVLQTEEGNPTGPDTSYAGYCVGDILVSTDGASTFTVSANGRVTVGPDERSAAGLPRTLPLDDVVDREPPRLSEPLVSDIAMYSATIAWTTDESSTSVVRYGLTTDHGSTASAGGLATSHSVTLTGLSPLTLYHFRIESTDEAGNTARGTDVTLRTGGLASYAPSATTVLQGKRKGGDFIKLAKDDGKFFEVESTKTGTRTTDWYGSATAAAALAADATLTVAYSGKNSRTVEQGLFLWSWSESTWTHLDTRSVGSTEQLLSLGPVPALPHVSPTGEIRLRILGTGTTADFKTSGDLMRLTLESAGSSP
jgi:beta-lactamase superfamily II metal-dependent hydrolase